MPQCLRIFISAPADVLDERLRAGLIIDKLSQDYGGFFAFVREMRMQVQNRMLVLWAMTAGVVMAGALFAVSPAAADDVETCTNSSKSDVAIAACRRAIASGQYTTQNRATLYTSRGLAYEVTDQFERAIQDFDQAMRLDPQFAHGDRTDPVVVGDGLFVFCCRTLVFDTRIKATWAIGEVRGNADLERCATACFEKLDSSQGRDER